MQCRWWPLQDGARSSWPQASASSIAPSSPAPRTSSMGPFPPARCAPCSTAQKFSIGLFASALPRDVHAGLVN
jgi:hypothetical protein